MTLRITLEIVPLGEEKDKRTIRTIDVSNIGRYDNRLHSYSIKVDGELINSTIRHNRDNGAERLAEKALALVSASDKGKKAMRKIAP